MKKLLILTGCLTLLMMTSCTKKYITESTPSRTVFFTIKTSDWKAPEANAPDLSYTAVLPIEALDEYTQANNGVQVAISSDQGNTYEYLPETYNGVSYSYYTSTNTLSISAQGVDGSQLQGPPPDLDIKVILIESVPVPSS